MCNLIKFHQEIVRVLSLNEPTPLSPVFHLYHGGNLFLMEETTVTRENHRPASSHWLYHRKLYQVHPSTSRNFKLTTLVVIGTDHIGRCKSYYDMITAMLIPFSIRNFIMLKMKFYVHKKHCDIFETPSFNRDKKNLVTGPKGFKY